MEASYCYIAAEMNQWNKNNKNSDSDDSDASDKPDITMSCETNTTNMMSNQDDQLNATTNINDLKKNLCNEEEFRSINHLEPIHIFLKLKPLSDQELRKQNNLSYFRVHSDSSISVRLPKTSAYAQNKQTAQSLSQTLFNFSYIFQSDITQKDFFSATIYPCFEKFFNGDSLLIFSYGVTNSGKTYTMQGTNSNPGLIPRTLDYLFDSLKDNLETKRSIYQFKPDKFNEICSLSESQLNQELQHKEQLLRMSSFKDIERSESFDSLANIGLGSLENTKKFGGSLDCLSNIANDTNTFCGPLNANTIESLNKLRVPAHKKYSIWISFYELYSDGIYDLLTIPNSKTSRTNERPMLKIREDINRIPYVEGLVYIPVSNTREAIKVLKYGEKNLQKSSNSINATSSRSHAIFCLKIVSFESNSSSTASTQKTLSVNQLCFCDLAGLERGSKTQSVGKTQREASFINTSLLSLSRCINLMIYNQKNKNNPMQVPYRENKLPRLFQAYFEGRGMVKMIVNLNPSLSCFDESINVLKFSSIANQIQIGLNDEDKVQYKIEEPVNNRLTVAWEGDKISEEEDDEEETDESGDDEEDEETEEDNTAEEEEEDVSMQAEDDEDEEMQCEDDEEEESGEEETNEEEDATSEESEEETEDDEEDEEEESESSETEETELVEESLAQTTVQTDHDETSHSVKKPKISSTRIGESQIQVDDEDEEEDDEEEQEEEGDESEEGEAEESTEIGSEEGSEESVEYENSSQDQDEQDEDEEEEEDEDDDDDEQEEIEETNLNSDADEEEEEEHEETQEQEMTTDNGVIENSIINSSKNDTTRSISKSTSFRVKKTPFARKTKEVKCFTTAKKANKKKVVNLKMNKTTEADSKTKNKTLNTTNDSSNRIAKKVEYANMRPDELLTKIKLLEEKMEEDRKDYLRLESHLRHDLVNKWSKRLEENESYYQEQIRVQRAQVEEIYIKRMDMFEKIMQSKAQNELEEVKKSKQAELDEMTQRMRELTDRIDELGRQVEENKVARNQSAFETHLKLDNDDEKINETVDRETQSDWHQEPERQVANMSMQTSMSNFLHEQSMQTEMIKKKSIGLEVTLADEEMNDLKEEHDRKRQECEILSEKLVQNSAQLDEMKSKLHQQVEFNTELKSESSSLKTEIESIRNNYEQLLNEQGKELKKALEHNEKHKIEIQRIKVELDESTELVEKLNKKLTQAEQEKAALKQSHKSNESKLHESLELFEHNKQALEDAKTSMAQLETNLTELNKSLMRKDGEIEDLKNELQFKQNQIDKMFYEFEKQREKYADLEKNFQHVSQQLEAERAKNLEAAMSHHQLPTDAAKPPISAHNSKKLLRDELIDDEILKEYKEESKPVKKTSTTSLRKSSRSKTNLRNSSTSNLEASKSSTTATSSKTAKKKQPNDEEEDVLRELPLNKHSKLEDTAEIINMSTASAPGPKEAAVTRKKSTLNRITEMITKSPILEPLRNRPQRQTKLKSSASNASDCAHEPVEKKTKTMWLSRGVNIADSLEKLEDDENKNPMVEAETKAKAKTTRKKKVTS